MTIHKTLVALALVAPALSAFALDQASIEKSVTLKDGSTVHQFRDGKMAMEDKFGQAYSMQDGEVMQTSDGTTIQMRGNEVARLSRAIEQHYKGGHR